MAIKITDILAHFERTTDQFFSKDELRAKLKSGRQLRIKYGVDVTAPTLHIGHAVNLWLMRYLQNHGHKVIFVIGDFTTRIGDPDGKMETRPVIPREEIERNAQEFIEQARMVLRFDDPELIEVRRNSEWLDQMKMQDFMDLLSMVTHAKLISRDMFQRRIEDGREIHMHELLYPVLQGYDSVVVQSDLTIIGSDQLFNEMMGRFFQEKFKQKPQTIVTTQITQGIDGKGKQSKSVGNYIGLAHSPRDKFGRVMSIPDKLILEYFRVYTDLPDAELEDMKKLIDGNPRDAKMKLAYSIVSRYHGHETGVNEQNWFENTFSKGLVPEDIPTLSVINPRISVLDLVVLARPGKSKGDSRRLIKQGGVDLNSEKLEDPEQMLVVQTNDVLQVGKRGWFRIEVVRLNDLETEHLWMRPLELRDLDLLQAYIPDWDIVKYLGKLPESKKIPAKDMGPLAREVFKKVIMQPEPKDEWLWKIIPKEDPEKVAGVAHLRRDADRATRNVWLAERYRTPAMMAEAAMAVNEHAFAALGMNDLIFQEAFAHAATPHMMEEMRKKFSGIDAALKSGAAPDASWGFTQGAWEQMREWWKKMNPISLDSADSPEMKEAQGAPETPETKKERDKLIAAMEKAKQTKNLKTDAPKPPAPKVEEPKKGGLTQEHLIGPRPPQPGKPKPTKGGGNQ